MKNIELINKNGESINFKGNPNYTLQKIEGIEKIGVTDKTKKQVRQDGEVYLYSDFEKRQIIINFIVKGQDYDQYLEARNRIIQHCNPKEEMILIYTNEGVKRSIKCKAESTPDMPINGFRKVVGAEVILVAYHPFWEDVDIIINEISVWTGGMTFPLTLPFSLKQKGDPQIDIFIEGHVETPVEIIFHGPADEPTVTNLTTGEFIKINRPLTSDETLFINTAFGQKTVEVEANGIRQNAFNYIDLNSTFFNLQPGDNLIEYTAGGEVTPQGVEIRYKNRYLGV